MVYPEKQSKSGCTLSTQSNLIKVSVLYDKYRVLNSTWLTQGNSLKVSVHCFTTQIVQYLIFLNGKFDVSIFLPYL